MMAGQKEESINRIRLEFKGRVTCSLFAFLSYRINRIRLEFKVFSLSEQSRGFPVLIESDWNLKSLAKRFLTNPWIVLIESDWNLKQERSPITLLLHFSGINRIRLEFKATPDTGRIFCICVLIESDWNLK